MTLCQSGEGQYASQSGRRARPIAFDCRGAGMFGRVSERDGHDDRVIDETDHGNEIRNQVNGR